MTKRKGKKAAPPKKKSTKLDKEFNCPFCSHNRSISVAVNKKQMTASLMCRVCGCKYASKINSGLCEAVDVYSNWLDKCVETNKQFQVGYTPAVSATSRAAVRGVVEDP